MLRTSTTDLLTVRLAQEQARGRLPSVAAGLVRDGELVWSAGRGTTAGSPGVSPGPDVQYRCGSITKTFVAVAVMRLCEEGRLALDEPVQRHLPDTGLGTVTVAQLLSHCGGLRAETRGEWWERTPGGPFGDLAASSLGEHAGPLAPGERFHYTNVGFAVLGELVARLRGRPWDEVVRTELLDPLGMTRTTPRPAGPAARGFAVHPWADVVLPEPEHDAGAMAPAGQLWTTVRDLGRWAAFLAGRVPGPLPAATLAEMRRMRTVDDRPGLAWEVGYGLGIQVWNVAGHRRFGHGGSMPGFLAALQVEAGGPPEGTTAGDAAIVLANTTAGMDHALAGDLLDLLARHEPVAPQEWAPGPVAAGALELAGTWYWGPSPFSLSAAASGLLDLEPLGHGGRGSRFRPAGPDRWTGMDSYYAGETLRVRRDATGTVVDLDLASFVLTRTPYDPSAGVPGGVDPAGWGPAR